MKSKISGSKTSTEVKQQQQPTSQKPPGGSLKGAIFGILLGYKIGWYKAKKFTKSTKKFR